MKLVVKDRVELVSLDDDDEKAITLDSIAVEVICKKDNADELKHMVNKQLVERT